jgi:hypothetical protein
MPLKSSLDQLRATDWAFCEASPKDRRLLCTISDLSTWWSTHGSSRDEARIFFHWGQLYVMCISLRSFTIIKQPLVLINEGFYRLHWCQLNPAPTRELRPWVHQLLALWCVCKDRWLFLSWAASNWPATFVLARIKPYQSWSRLICRADLSTRLTTVQSVIQDLNGSMHIWNTQGGKLTDNLPDGWIWSKQGAGS